MTGASSGIGAAFATRLARQGYDLVLVARNRLRLAAQAKRLHRQARVGIDVLAADLTVAADLQRVADHIAADRRLTLLVNDAGFGTAGAFADLDAVREEDEIRLNVLAVVRLTRAALPGMIARRRGAIINVSSMAAFQPGPYTATYSATKAFVNAFTEAVHEELRGSGVRVQALCPGFTRTEFQKRARIDTSRIPSFVWMTADQVAAASLAALDAGEVICVPGLANRALLTMTGLVPHRITTRVAGVLSRRVLV